MIITPKITTAADNKFCDIFPNLKNKRYEIFHENRLPADDFPEISCLVYYFLIKQKKLKLSPAAYYRWLFMG